MLSKQKAPHSYLPTLHFSPGFSSISETSPARLPCCHSSRGSPVFGTYLPKLLISLRFFCFLTCSPANLPISNFSRFFHHFHVDSGIKMPLVVWCLTSTNHQKSSKTEKTGKIRFYFSGDAWMYHKWWTQHVLVEQRRENFFNIVLLSWVLWKCGGNKLFANMNTLLIHSRNNLIRLDNEWLSKDHGA